MSLDALPAELYDAILLHLPSCSRSSDTASLIRALPKHSRIPDVTTHLFASIHITRPKQLHLLERRLKTDLRATQAIRELRVECWGCDPEIVVMLIRRITRVGNTGVDPAGGAEHRQSQLVDLRLWIGSTFAPEHMEVIFERPILGLKFLGLRFRPYVKQATYFQFLAGKYFDSMLVTLSSWPRSYEGMRTLSIIQDPLPDGTQRFAQPLVFHRIDNIASLTGSPHFSTLSAFKLRIPSRQVAPHIHLRNPQYIDMSTSAIGPEPFDVLLAKYVTTLMHLVIDGSNVVGHTNSNLLSGPNGERDLWQAFGKRCALAGVRRAKTREKNLKAWLDIVERAYRDTRSVQELQEEASEEAAAAAAAAKKKKKKKGRSGLATATISLRASQPPSEVDLPTMDEVSKDLSLNGMKTLVGLKIRIMPPSPKLQTLCVTSRTTNIEHVGVDNAFSVHSSVRSDFALGWAQGLAQTESIRLMHTRSMANGNENIRIVRFQDDEEEYDGQPRSIIPENATGLDGLVDVTYPWMEKYSVERNPAKVPILCLAGEEHRDNVLDQSLHTPGCGHTIAGDIFD